MNPFWEDIFHNDIGRWKERYRWEFNQDHLVLKNNDNLLVNYHSLHEVCQLLQRQAAYLVVIIASDERRLEDGCFKLYYIFSHEAEDRFLVLEYALRKHNPIKDLLAERLLSKYLLDGRAYPSIREVFAAAGSFEREIFDLFDLVAVAFDDSDAITSANPISELTSRDFVLHNPYPPYLAPLEVGKKIEDIQKEIKQYTAPTASFANVSNAGEVLLTVGPIHAGVIEAGRFSFHIAGEVVDELGIQLGFKHKGIEKLFQTKFSLLDGWQLAERISGDSSFAHSLAYCHAVEALAHIDIPTKATWLRGLFLELERLYNHIADSGALAHDVAFNLVASEMAVIREYLVQLNAELTGHRLLRGVIRPGGIVFPSDQMKVIDNEAIDKLIYQASRQRFGTLKDLMVVFHELGELLLRTPAFRDRALNTGNLTRSQAVASGATGLVARASGIVQRDFRVNHPFGIYNLEPKLQEIVDLHINIQGDHVAKKLRSSGDVYSRLEMRLHEVDTSIQVIRYILQALEITPADTLIAPDIEKAIRGAENFVFALGYVEGWRGDIVYWLMKDRFNKIFRCKVRDPSFLNWPALRLAVIPDDLAQPDATGNILPDFPIINKSFNLSYSGHDL